MLDVVAVIITLSPLRTSYYDSELYNYINAILSIIKHVLNVDMKAVPRQMIIDLFRKVIAVKLYVGKQPIERQSTYFKIVDSLFAGCSKTVTKEDIMGIHFIIKNDESEDIKSLYSLLNIDFIVYFCLLRIRFGGCYIIIITKMLNYNFGVRVTRNQ